MSQVLRRIAVQWLFPVDQVAALPLFIDEEIGRIEFSVDAAPVSTASSWIEKTFWTGQRYMGKIHVS